MPLTGGATFLFKCMIPILLKLTLLPLLVAIAAPISAILNLFCFLFTDVDQSLADLSNSSSRNLEGSGARDRFCVVIWNAASSFEAEALVRWYASLGERMAVIAVDRNVAVLTELYKHETRNVHCIGINSTESAARELIDTVAKTGRALFGFLVVEPSGECVMRRLLEREAILGNNLRPEFVHSSLLAALCDFCTVRAETTAAPGEDFFSLEFYRSHHQQKQQSVQATNFDDPVAANRARELSDAIMEVSVSQPTKILAVALSALAPVMLFDSRIRPAGSAAARGGASDTSSFLSSIMSRGRRATNGGGGVERFYLPRVTYVSRNAESAAAATCLAYISAVQQHLVPHNSSISVIQALPGITNLRQSAARATLQAGLCDGIVFSEVSLFATSKQANAQRAFELSMAEFCGEAATVAATNSSDGAAATTTTAAAAASGPSALQAANRNRWRVPAVIHGRNVESLVANSFSASPRRDGSPSGSGTSSPSSPSSFPSPSPAAAVGSTQSSQPAAKYERLIAALGRATAAATPERLSFCACLQPALRRGEEISNNGAKIDASFVNPSWWTIVGKRSWLREERMIRDLVAGDLL